MGHEATTTFISAATLVRGDIHSEDDLAIDGRVEGDIMAQGVVTIEPTAEVLGNVTAGDVVVLGSIEGDIMAAGAVEIGQGGSVAGDIKATRVLLSEGAVFRGSIDMGPEQERSRKATPHRPSRAASEASRSRHQAQRTRRPILPHQSVPPSVPATVPALPPHMSPKSNAAVSDAVVPLRAPEPKVRGVGRTTAFKK
jgi:cytoskeletal protein CcmA (bactofilin family)